MNLKATVVPPTHLEKGGVFSLLQSANSPLDATKSHTLLLFQYRKLKNMK